MKLLNQQVVASFFECKRKAFLLFNSTKNYGLTEYESIVNDSKINTMDKFFEQNKPLDYSTGILSKGVNFVANTRIQLENYFLTATYLSEKLAILFWVNFITYQAFL